MRVKLFNTVLYKIVESEFFTYSSHENHISTKHLANFHIYLCTLVYSIFFSFDFYFVIFHPLYNLVLNVQLQGYVQVWAFSHSIPVITMASI